LLVKWVQNQHGYRFRVGEARWAEVWAGGKLTHEPVIALDDHGVGFEAFARHFRPVRRKDGV
jgi:hypothetical protein